LPLDNFFFIKQITELSEIKYIENLPILRILNLLRNPIQVRGHLHQERGAGGEGNKIVLELFFFTRYF
jgi:hypothetical protein